MTRQKKEVQQIVRDPATQSLGYVTNLDRPPKDASKVEIEIFQPGSKSHHRKGDIVLVSRPSK